MRVLILVRSGRNDPISLNNTLESLRSQKHIEFSLDYLLVCQFGLKQSEARFGIECQWVNGETDRKEKDRKKPR